MPSDTGQMRVVYDNFSSGDYGTLDGSRAPVTSFKAENMLVSADGCLVPRPGWRNRTPAGMPNGKVVALVPTQTPGRDMVLIIGNKVYTYNLQNLAAGVTEIGTLDATPTKALYPKKGTAQFYITIPGDKSYKIDPVTNTIDPYSASPGGTELEIYGQRLVVVDNSVPYRIKFSAPADFDTWPAENFIDVGDNWGITALREQNNHLAVLKSRGQYLLSGVPGTSSATVRKANRAKGPLHPGQVDLDDSDMAHMISAFHQNPATFDGLSTKQYTPMRLLATNRDGDTPDLPLVLGVATSAGDNSPNTLAFVQGGGINKMLLNHNGVWTVHHNEANLSGMVRGGETGDFYITDGGTAGTPANIYSNQFDINRPAFTTDGLVGPGDGVDTPLYAEWKSPQHWPPLTRYTKPGTMLQVRSVVVDFFKYNTGTTAHNHFDLDVNMLGRIYTDKGDASVVTQSFDEAGSAAGGTIGDFRRERWVKGFKSAKAGGFELRMRNIRGIKIRQITVIFDNTTTEPVS